MVLTAFGKTIEPASLAAAGVSWLSEPIIAAAPL